jgi:hypothetical protein
LLVAIDFSADSLAALASVREMARRLGGELVLLHVSEAADVVPGSDLAKHDSAHWQAELDAEVAQLHVAGLRARAIVRPGYPVAEAIVEAAREERGRHTRHGIARAERFRGAPARRCHGCRDRHRAVSGSRHVQIAAGRRLSDWSRVTWALECPRPIGSGAHARWRGHRAPTIPSPAPRAIRATSSSAVAASLIASALVMIVSPSSSRIGSMYRRRTPSRTAISANARISCRFRLKMTMLYMSCPL